MGELMSLEYSQPDIVDPQRWVDYRNGILYLLDPATGERLKTDEPPLWLASDDRLGEGYQALGNPADDHPLTIALSRHELASDLGKREHRFGWFERTHAHGHVHAFEESGGWDPAAWNEVLQDLRSRTQWPPGLSNSPKFADRLLRSALKHQHVVTFSYDVEKTDRPIDKLLLEMISSEAASSRLRRMSFPVRHTLRFAAGALREWYIPGKYMYELRRLAAPASPRVLFTLGAAHGDVPRKFRTFGFSPKVHHFHLSKRDRGQAEIHTQAMREGRIDFQTLGKLSLT